MKNNAITDVLGTRVGHFTLADGDVQTGLTILIPADGNVFQNPLVAAVHVINGFGKSTGLMQIEELGQLETPMVLTNTLQVGKGIDALIQLCIEEYDKELSSINPVVLECNDSYLNNIQERRLSYEALRQAYDSASEVFEQGAVGAGRGMSCFQFKGGIGTASQAVIYQNETYALGALVLTNFGRQGDLLKPHEQGDRPEITAEKGSCIIILGTDAPLDSRQLKRVAKRAEVGLARLGGHIGHGSGEVAVAYSTANRLNKRGFVDQIRRFPEDQLDLFFRAVIHVVEEAVVNSMRFAETVEGVGGHVRKQVRFK